MLQVNTVFSLSGGQYRVLWSNSETTILIDLDGSGAFPEKRDTEELERLFAEGAATVVDDPFLAQTMAFADEDSKAFQVRERGWRLIRDIVDTPAIFDKAERGALVRKVLGQHQTTKQTIYRLLRRYWQRGMTINALLPDYHLSGAAGKRRKAKGRLGRKRSRREGERVLITPDIERLFRMSIESAYLKSKKKRSLASAYRHFMNLYKARYAPSEDWEYPTKRQFQFFASREYEPREVVRRRTSDIIYNKDIRPLTSTSNSEVFGPGARFQIDATIADVYLVSTVGRSKIVGRPVVYFVIDVFSRMVAGLYVGFEGPSYASAMMALAHASADKVSYCDQLGISIEMEDWPTSGLPDAILADRGELLGHQVNALITRFGVRIENAPAYRGDAKGIVERYFRTVQEEFKPFAEGVVDGKPSKKRGVRDYRLDATLTIDDFTRMIVHSVLWHNQNRSLEKYDRDADLPDDLPSVPLELWSWGLANRTGRLRRFPEKIVAISLLPQKEATVSELGICLFGAYYTCQEALQTGWFDRVKGNRPKKVLVAYDHRYVDRIYLFPDANKPDYWPCDLTNRSRRFAGMTFHELWRKKDAETRTQAKAKSRSEVTQAELERRLEEIAAHAREQKPDLGDVSSRERLRDIRGNREEEKHRERKAAAAKIHKKRQKGSAEIIRLVKEDESDFSYPDMVDSLFDDEDEADD
ncbi:Mu transposase C-terminal domain-containing protein [Aestuariispira ectoiniformans]|uniref:Mu transposase C-terminal domain-containing protein n=1 Tax=Aestuariispira ectoiniformans TaxID=2775080 RepID=UPI00223BF3DB|nr:Mu transposase C-terminal domain-containing protein [Aestuariispira ectoiniformans]